MPPPSPAIAASFAALERQQQLISTCTALYKDLTDHFSSLNQSIDLRSDSIRSKRKSLDSQFHRNLISLQSREESIDSSVNLAISRLKQLSSSPSGDLSGDLSSRLRSLAGAMESTAFFDLIVSSRKESDLLRQAIPIALKECIDPAKFVMDAISRVFSSGEFGWVCVMMLEGLVEAMEDPVMGRERMMVTRKVRERAVEMADAWKEGMGIAKAQDVHAFLQHLVTFGIGEKEERGFYRKLVVSVSWRKQMPRIAVALGLEDVMGGM